MTDWFPKRSSRRGNRYYSTQLDEFRRYRQGLGWETAQVPSGWIGAFASRTAAAGSVTASNQVAYTGSDVEVAAFATTGGGRQQFLESSV